MALSIMKICLAFEENTQDIQLVDGELFEGRAIVKEIDDATTDVDKLSKEAETSEKIVEILGGNDKVSVEAIQLAEINLSSLRRKLNYRSSSVSVESVRNLQIALEEEKGFLARIWDMIKAVFKWIGEKVSQFVNWIKGLFGGGKQQKIEAIVQKAASDGISLEIKPKESTHPANLQTAVCAQVISDAQNKIMDKQSASLKKALDRLDNGANNADTQVSSVIKKVKSEAAKHNIQHGEVTSNNVKQVVEEVVEKTCYIDLNEQQTNSLHMFANYKNEFVEHYKNMDITELNHLKDCINLYIKEAINTFKNIDVKFITGLIKDDQGLPKINEKFFSSFFSEASISHIFGKLLSSSNQSNGEKLYRLTVLGMNLEFTDWYRNSEIARDRRPSPMELFKNKDASKNNSNTVKITSADIDFLSKNIGDVITKLSADVEKLTDQLLDKLVKTASSEATRVADSLRDAYKTMPKDEKGYMPSYLGSVIACLGNINSMLGNLIRFWKKITGQILSDAHDVSKFLIDIVSTLDKANKKSEETKAWLVGYNWAREA